MIRLLYVSFKNQWSAHLKRPLEFLSALVAIILNNSLYLYGIYLLAVLSIGDDPIATKVYLSSTGMVLTAWGLLNVFGGGLYQLGSLIENGELETYLAKPRPSLFLVAISKCNLISLGEIIQGIVTIFIISYLYGSLIGLRTFISSLILTFSFSSVIILIGSFSFFSSRGSQFSYCLLQVILSLSLFPVGQALRGREKWILYFTPLLMTAFLPRMLVLYGGALFYIVYILSTLIFLGLTILFYQFGLRHFKARNYISINDAFI